MDFIGVRRFISHTHTHLRDHLREIEMIVREKDQSAIHWNIFCRIRTVLPNYHVVAFTKKILNGVGGMILINTEAEYQAIYISTALNI